jgi:2-succinyl-5-enolpyruvyl-6-hydroxy-3-cyclohexene-1-carboxylate synthase
MSPTTDTYVLLRAFVDELARCGCRDACTSPGSRNAPLVLTLARERRLRCHSHIDERCAGFFALGLAKATGRPTVLTCTSGTAVAELLPAVIEAREARVPLLVLSADRPPELRANGAGQTIDQLKLFGDAAKWFFEVGTHAASVERLRWMRTLACRAWWTALEGRPGVVHLNFALREPLVSDEPLPDDSTGRADGRPYLLRPGPLAAADAHGYLPGDRPPPHQAGGGGELADRRQGEQLLELIAAARRGLLVAGRHERPVPLGPAADDLCRALGWPLLADPLSRARRGRCAIAHYDALLRDGAFARAQRPDLVLRVGDLPTSRPLREWLATLEGATQVSLDPELAWQDPGSLLSWSFALEPASALSMLAADPRARSRPAESEWLERWTTADERAAGAITSELAAGGLSEPAVAAELGRLLPSASTLFVASSMPVRDVEGFWPALEAPPRVLCNRGANGIDGTISSAFGASVASPGPVVALIGDVAFAHDIGGLLAASRLGLKLTIVLLNNAGGGIFDFLAVSRNASARAGDIYTTHIATPTGLDFASAGDLYCLAHEHATDVPGLRRALESALASPQSAIVEVRTERDANVALHARVWDAVSGAISPTAAAGAPPA